MDKRVAQNLRVKGALMEAYLRLLGTHPDDNISVTMIAREAGVSRMAYYRNFESKGDIIRYFLEEVFREILGQLSEGCTFWSREYGYILLNVLYRHREQFLLLDESGHGGMVLAMFNDASLELAGDVPYNSVERYRLYLASGATLNGTMEWFRGGCRESLDDFFAVMLDFLGANIA